MGAKKLSSPVVTPLKAETKLMPGEHKVLCEYAQTIRVSLGIIIVTDDNGNEKLYDASSNNKIKVETGEILNVRNGLPTTLIISTDSEDETDPQK